MAFLPLSWSISHSFLTHTALCLVPINFNVDLLPFLKEASFWLGKLCVSQPVAWHTYHNWQQVATTVEEWRTAFRKLEKHLEEYGFDAECEVLCDIHRETEEILGKINEVITVPSEATPPYVSKQSNSSWGI